MPPRRPVAAGRRVCFAGLYATALGWEHWIGGSLDLEPCHKTANPNLVYGGFINPFGGDVLPVIVGTC